MTARNLPKLSLISLLALAACSGPETQKSKINPAALRQPATPTSYFPDPASAQRRIIRLFYNPQTAEASIRVEPDPRKHITLRQSTNNYTPLPDTGIFNPINATFEATNAELKYF